MAELRLTIGPKVATVTASDQNAQDVLSEYLVVKGGPVGGTDQEKMDWLVADLVSYLKDVASTKRRRSADTIPEFVD
jgi:hypothetical protein